MKTFNNNWENVEKVINKYSTMLFRISYSYTNNREDTEDILQDVFVKYSQQKKFVDEGHERAWLIRVTINQSINLMKSAYKRKIVSVGDMPVPTQGNDGDNKNTSIVMELPIKYRTPIYLYYYEGYTVEEIAEILGKNKSTVYTLINRGKKKLKEIIEGGRENE